MWVFALILFILFFLMFPRFTILGVLLAIGGVVYWVWNQIDQEQARERATALVSVSVKYDQSGQSCDDPDFPLALEIVNDSTKIVEHTYWDIEVRRPGYSNNLVQNYSGRMETDRIIYPRQRWSLCARVPRSVDTYGLEQEQFIYEVSGKRVTFR